MRVLARLLFLACVLVAAAMIVPTPSYADPMDDYIKSVTETCNKLTQEKEKLTNLAKQKGIDAVQEQMDVVKEYVDRARDMIKQIKDAPPRTAAERDAQLRRIKDTLGVANTAIKTAQRRLGLTPFGAITANAQECMTKISKCFDAARTSVDPTPADIDIPRQPGNDFFQIQRCKTDVERRAAEGATKIKGCGVCSEAKIQQDLKKLSGFRDELLRKCETN